jgi:hypothetical protein
VELSTIASTTDQTIDATHIDKLLESRIASLFLFKLVLPEKLVSTVRHKWLEALHLLEQDISDARDHVSLLLPLRELLRQDHIDRKDLVGVPEHLLHKFLPLGSRYDIRCTQRFDPLLQEGVLMTASARK